MSMIHNRRWFVVLAAAFAVVALGQMANASSGPGGATCSGGSVAPGTYSSLQISGACKVDAGSVSVEHDLTVLPGAALLASYGGTDKDPVGSNLNVGGNIYVMAGAILALGCEPENYICTNDPDQSVGSYFTRDSVGGSILAEDALTVLVHLTTVQHDILMTGGGGGVSCSRSLPVLGGSPSYGDFEDVIVGGNLSITKFQSCWLGLFRVTVGLNVEFNDNVNADPDSNEMGTNSILGNLSCAGNNPMPQLGDSAGSLSNVFGHALGQCANSALTR